jgi:hypothetical protein
MAGGTEMKEREYAIFREAAKYSGAYDRASYVLALIPEARHWPRQLSAGNLGLARKTVAREVYQSAITSSNNKGGRLTSVGFHQRRLPLVGSLGR